MKEYQGIRTAKKIWFRNRRNDIKKFCDRWEKTNQYLRQTAYTSQDLQNQLFNLMFLL